MIGYPKFRNRFTKIFGALPTRRAKKKLKSVYHYLVNNDIENGRHFYKQLELEYEKKRGDG